MTDSYATVVVDDDELATLLSTLDRLRRTFAWKCDGGLPGAVSWPGGRTPNLRRIIVDMIEEYARHTGHADLLREAVDRLVGEDAPA